MLAGDVVALGEEPATEAEILVGQDDARAGAAGGEGGHQARRPAADHQHVAERACVFVAIRVFGLGGAAQAGGAADGRLVDLLPEPRRPHESLVVEAGREKRREQAVDRQDIEAERRPAVLARGVETVVKLDRRGARVGLAPGAGAQLDEGVGLLRAGRHDAARPVIFERAADQAHAVRDQRRGQRVAGEADIAFAVEVKIQLALARDKAAVRKPVRLRIAAAVHRAESFANSTDAMACVRVSRVTTSQARQPPP